MSFMLKFSQLAVVTASSLLLLSSCTKDDTVPLRAEAWVPIYLDNASSKIIKSKEARAPKVGGKIYAYQQYLFQLEPGQGIHVYQLEDKKPKPYSFIQVYGAQEISIRNGVLYSNNFKDIVSVDIHNLTNVSELGRVQNVFDIRETNVPYESGYFECVDHSKGVVIGWELKQNVRVKCKTR